ncbi:MAG TPA: beta-eliminating lyase-related protein [Kineosporiaceae bacterium]
MVQHSFASDNYAPVHPEVLDAVVAANQGHAVPYGADPLSRRATEVFRQHLGEHAEVAIVFNGTGANVTALSLLLRPWEHVVCARTAHIAVDECGAPERILGVKLVDLDTPDGKLTPELVRRARTGVGDEHRTQPRVVSITQSTELGTLYTPAEIRALADTAHGLGMYLHLDGARIANAAASLGVSLRETSTDCGVDVLSFGGTKNGLLGGEAVVVLAPELSEALPFARKQAMQLGSKLRYTAAQFIALLRGDLWYRNAAHANAMAARLHDAVADVPGVTVTRPRQANAVFATLPEAAIPPLQKLAHFYEWDESTHEVRWMCSWDTTERDVDTFAAAVRETVSGIADGWAGV